MTFVLAGGPVPALLARQTETGQWAGEHSFYTPKYVSTHWSMMLLTELAIDGTDARFRQGVAYMLAATAADLQKRLDVNHLGFSCFWSNMLRYTYHAGQGDDGRESHQSCLSACLVSGRAHDRFGQENAERGADAGI